MNQPADLLARFPNISRPAQWPRTVQLGVIAFEVALYVVVLLWTCTPDYKVLFSDLTDRDGGAVVTALTQMNIPYQFSDDGTSILMPGNKVYECNNPKLDGAGPLSWPGDIRETSQEISGLIHSEPPGGSWPGTGR